MMTWAEVEQEKRQWHRDQFLMARQAGEFEAERKRLEHVAEYARRRAPIATALLPPNGVSSLLAQHAVSIALRHGLTIRHESEGHGFACAYRSARTVYVPKIFGEVEYNTFLHEVGHVLDERANAERLRHVVKGPRRVSPLAECGAWRYVLQVALRWTCRMQQDLETCISTYLRSATGPEADVIRHVVKEGVTRLLRDDPRALDEAFAAQRAKNRAARTVSPSSRTGVTMSTANETRPDPRDETADRIKGGYWPLTAEIRAAVATMRAGTAKCEIRGCSRRATRLVAARILCVQCAADARFERQLDEFRPAARARRAALINFSRGEAR